MCTTTHTCVYLMCVLRHYIQTQTIYIPQHAHLEMETHAPQHIHTHTVAYLFCYVSIYLSESSFNLALQREICDYVLFIAEIAQKKRQKSTENAQNKIFSVETVRFSTKSERLRQRNVHHHVKKKKS